MSKHIDYYLSLQSPWTYLGHQKLLDIVRGTDATMALKPVNLATLFSATGGLPLPKRGPQRQAYRLVELQRWSKHLNQPLNLHPMHFPVDERPAAGMVIALDRSNHRSALELAGAMLRAVWAEDRNLADRDTLTAIASENDQDGDSLLAESAEPEIDAIIARNTQEAIAANVFGVPNYVVNGEPHWGQDRLEFVKRALAEQ